MSLPNKKLSLGPERSILRFVSRRVFQFVAFLSSFTIAQAVGEVDQARLEHWAYRPPVEEAFSWLNTERIQNGMTIIALQWLQLHHVEIRTKWRSTG